MKNYKKQIEKYKLKHEKFTKELVKKENRRIKKDTENIIKFYVNDNSYIQQLFSHALLLHYETEEDILNCLSKKMKEFKNTMKLLKRYIK